jgi:hypothetical protein
MVFRTVVAFNYVIGTMFVYDAYQAYADHSAMSVFRWAALYVVAVIQPVAWGFYHLRVLKRKGLAIDGQIRLIAFSPMVIGGVTLLIALNLIHGR